MPLNCIILQYLSISWMFLWVIAYIFFSGFWCIVHRVQGVQVVMDMLIWYTPVKKKNLGGCGCSFMALESCVGRLTQGEKDSRWVNGCCKILE